MIADLCLQPITDKGRCQLLAEHIVPCSDDPDGGYIPLPADPWNEIVPGLWQGGSHTGAHNYDPTEGNFRSVLTAYRNAPFAQPPVLERRFHFGDADVIPNDLAAAVDWVYGRWSIHRERVLVRCQGGLNRSGLIVALVLRKDGHSIVDAIDLIRSKRSPYALCNQFFVTYLESLT